MSQQGARRVQSVRLCQNQRSTGSPNTASLRLNCGHIHDPANHEQDGNAWCHVGTCQGSYQAYRINIWGLQKHEENKKNGVIWCPNKQIILSAIWSSVLPSSTGRSSSRGSGAIQGHKSKFCSAT